MLAEIGSYFSKVTSALPSTDFNDPASRIDSLKNVVQLSLKCLDQGLLSAVSNSNPYEFASRFRCNRQIVEVFIFADKHHVVLNSVLPNDGVWHVTQSQIPNMP